MDNGEPIFTMPDDPGAPGSAPARSRLASSYVGRHWRGELSLPVSYWVNIAVVSGVLTILSMMIQGSQTSWATSASVTVLAIVGIWVVVVATVVWQVVGAWRSAERHESRGGRRFWANVAKVMLFVIVLRNGMAFVTAGVPQLLDAYDIATGDAALGVAVLRPLNNGRELEIIGGITYGLTEKVAKEVKALPALRTIHLNSPGGRVTEAEMLRAFIRDHGYDTYISTECVSACSTAFLGGVRRFLHPNARIGFHVPSVAGATERDRKAAEGYAVADAVKWGVDPRFAEKAFATRHDDMWYPDASEALAAHVVTDISDGGLAFSGLSASPDRVAVAQFLKTSEVYLAIAAAHPGVFDRLVGLFLDGAIKGTPEVELYDASGQIVHDLYEARLVAASDALLLRWMELQTVIIQAAMQADPQSCQAEVTAHGAPDQESPDASEALSQWKHDVLLEVLRHEHDVKPVTWNQAAAVSETFWDAVEARHGGAVVPMIERLNIVDDPLPESCKAALIVYETVGRMPARQGAMLLRWLITPVG